MKGFIQAGRNTNVREKPSTDSNRVAVMSANVSYYGIVIKEDDFYRVNVKTQKGGKLESIEGYVRSDLVSFIPENFTVESEPSKMVDFPLIPPATMVMSEVERKMLANLLFWVRLYVESMDTKEGTITLDYAEMAKAIALLEVATVAGYEAFNSQDVISPQK